MPIERTRSYVLGFAGQGAQKVGMGEEVASHSNAANDIFRRADQKLGYSVSKICFEDPKNQLRGDPENGIYPDTRVVHVAILTNAIAWMAFLREKGVFAEEFAAGHSLGQLCAAVAEKVIGFEDALDVAVVRGKGMWEEAQRLRTRVGMVVGLGGQAVSAKIESLNESPEIRQELESRNQSALTTRATVYNGSELTMIAGTEADMDLVARFFKYRPYPAAPMSHHPLLVEVQAQVGLIWSKMRSSLLDPYRPILDDVSNQLKTGVSQIDAAFATHLTSALLWVENAKKIGNRDFLEIGSDLLSNMSQRENPGTHYHPLVSLEQALKAIEMYGNPSHPLSSSFAY